MHGSTLALLAVTAGLASACAARIESPRKAYGLAGETAETGRQEPEVFRVLQSWDWPASLKSSPRERLGRDALASGVLGIWPAGRFRLADGGCRDCPTPDAVLWYFRDEVIAVPRSATAPRGARREEDDGAAGVDGALPSAVWIGAPEVIDSAVLSADGRMLVAGQSRVLLSLMPRNPQNSAWPDGRTLGFFAGRRLRVRGATDANGSFVARNVWPDDARIKALPAAEPLGPRETLGTLIEAQDETSRGDFPIRVLFQRGEALEYGDGMTAFAIVLSGAQSDDDGARAGHIGIATGLLGTRGEWRDWLVTNFYPLEERGPKGIISAAVPMDNYLLDFNSGQLYYRPAYMLAALLRRPLAAQEIEAAMQDTLLAYLCREIEFDTAGNNSTALSVDTLRGLGWRIPRAGPTSRILGLLGAPAAALARLSFGSGRNFFRTMTAETTRLLPRVAFEVAGHDLLYLLRHGNRESDLTRFERRLVDDVEAVLFMRLPQVPTSRPVGTFPERSLFNYGARYLAGPEDFVQAPGGEAAVLPESLKEGCGRPRAPAGSP